MHWKSTKKYRSVRTDQLYLTAQLESFYGNGLLILSMSADSEDDLKRIGYEKTSHQELPYLIHAKSNVPYFVGKHGHTIIAVELKKSGWKIRLLKNNNDKYILARKGKELWVIQIITIDTGLSDAIRKVKDSTNKELEAIAEEMNALPVIAVVAQDSAALISARTFTGLSLTQDRN